jgi:hypothetical protein
MPEAQGADAWVSYGQRGGVRGERPGAVGVCRWRGAGCDCGAARGGLSRAGAVFGAMRELDVR